jgi:hypothetical protein
VRKKRALPSLPFPRQGGGISDETRKRENDADDVASFRSLPAAPGPRDKMPTIDAVKETYTTVMAEMAAADDELKKKRDALEAEKLSMKGAHDVQKSKIKLRVGGVPFETSLTTLTSIPDNFFASMFSGNYEMLPDGDDGSYFIDRDGTHFRHILNFLREPDSTSNNKTCYGLLTKLEQVELDKELKFYGLYDRFHVVDWKFRELSREEAIAVKLLEDALEKDDLVQRPPKRPSKLNRVMFGASAVRNYPSKKGKGGKPPPNLLSNASIGQLMHRMVALKGSFNEEQTKELALLASEILNCLRSDVKITVDRTDATYDGIELRSTRNSVSARKSAREKKILDLLYRTTGEEFPDLKAARKVYKIPVFLFKDESYDVNQDILPALLSGSKLKDGFTKTSK